MAFFFRQRLRYDQLRKKYFDFLREFSLYIVYIKRKIVSFGSFKVQIFDSGKEEEGFR